MNRVIIGTVQKYQPLNIFPVCSNPAKQIITGKAILIPETNFDRAVGRWKEK
ncbi:hypothetical protein [Methanosarcina barkeri]|uniref:hypothetical protein n=1 Tax=Methanosarcina barkeri TaxID=2208 RepID=UPI000B2E1CA0|nr:hypothetical protein [Methanosarcina barkeri]